MAINRKMGRTGDVALPLEHLNSSPSPNTHTHTQRMSKENVGGIQWNTITKEAVLLFLTAQINLG
jgi:hypothetical protein